MRPAADRLTIRAACDQMEAKLRRFIVLSALFALTACGGSGGNNRQSGTGAAPPPTPAAVYCQRSGGEVIVRTSGGRRADLCKLPSGRTVRAADLLNSHNSL